MGHGQIKEIMKSRQTGDGVDFFGIDPCQIASGIGADSEFICPGIPHVPFHRQHCPCDQQSRTAQPVKFQFQHRFGPQGDKGESVYDDRGNLIKDSWYNSTENYSGWVEYEYDELGYLIKMIEYDGYGGVGSWENYEYKDNPWQYGDVAGWTVYKNDVNGNKMIEISYNEDRQIEERKVFDLNGNLIQEEFYDWNGEIISIYEYIYDSNNNLIKESKYASDRKIIYIYEYIYNKNGNLVTK